MAELSADPFTDAAFTAGMLNRPNTSAIKVARKTLFISYTSPNWRPGKVAGICAKDKPIDAVSVRHFALFYCRVQLVPRKKTDP